MKRDTDWACSLTEQSTDHQLTQTNLQAKLDQAPIVVKVSHGGVELNRFAEIFHRQVKIYLEISGEKVAKV